MTLARGARSCTRLRARCERAGDGYRGLLQHRRPDVEIDPARRRRQIRGGGKTLAKKDVALQAISYGNVYVARIAFGANPQQALQALREAEAYPVRRLSSPTATVSLTASTWSLA